MRPLPQKLIPRPRAAWRYAAAITLLLPQLFSGVAIAQESEPETFLLDNIARYSYFTQRDGGTLIEGVTNDLQTPLDTSLTDPRGQILGCGGQVLDNYSGFTVGLYSPAGPTQSELGSLIALTPTEVPDIPGNNIPLGISPNTTNLNPFPLSNASEGTYSFLLDPSRGQLSVGSTFILVVDPPEGSIYNQRRVRIRLTQITDTDNRLLVTYQATSLDGLPIAAGAVTDFEETATTLFTTVRDADNIPLQLLAINFSSTLCQLNQIEISKSGDRANAAPGDTVIYRLTIRNRSDGDLDTLTIQDVLPAGFKLLPSSVRGIISETAVPISVEGEGLNLTLRTNAVLPREGVLNIAYAAQLTPDAIRGDGRNSATVEGARVDNDLEVRDGPAVHRVRVNPGILTDCGNVLGRVFVDKNFDGEQQLGEPGIPNAVVWMDDGNRITTDENGLFHVKCVLPGARTGALDLTTLPGYTLAPNLHFAERNSPSRLVRLSPGGTVRMNFGVTPTFQEEAK
ncbi:hypothetical protein [Acaryochloris sp. IP29b_bin.148]|uniref:hypothetical protein n=1 Tax=Acaryochloris sp. IP29b_bin.148 TaxID=2969218 RepID=UPI002636C471|nr:hypothetical protein [Acaryochloris sp. IP29b_bin.148]